MKVPEAVPARFHFQSMTEHRRLMAPLYLQNVRRDKQPLLKQAENPPESNWGSPSTLQPTLVSGNSIQKLSALFCSIYPYQPQTSFSDTICKVLISDQHLLQVNWKSSSFHAEIYHVVEKGPNKSF